MHYLFFITSRPSALSHLSSAPFQCILAKENHFTSVLLDDQHPQLLCFTPRALVQALLEAPCVVCVNTALIHLTWEEARD